MITKLLLFITLILGASGFVKGQKAQSLTPGHQLTLEAAFSLTSTARATARSLGKQVSIAIVDQSGIPILISRGDGVGPHNTEAARRKAFTALSTKTGTLALGRNAKVNPDSENLAYLPELLLLGGGVPLWYDNKVVGAIGIAGGGGPEYDDQIARSAASKITGIIIKEN
jgi:uncharacterized protein GlcG (DUF336 family)